MTDLPGYDAWKTREPDWVWYQPECVACDDAGCPECCETFPITDDDLDEMDAQGCADALTTGKR